MSSPTKKPNTTEHRFGIAPARSHPNHRCYTALIRQPSLSLPGENPVAQVERPRHPAIDLSRTENLVASSLPLFLPERMLFLPQQQTEQSEHQALALPGKAAVYIEVHAPSHFLVDLKAMSEAAKKPAMNAGRRRSSYSSVGGSSGGRGGGRPGGGASQQSVEGDGGTSRLVDFLITVQQVSQGQREGALCFVSWRALASWFCGAAALFTVESLGASTQLRRIRVCTNKASWSLLVCLLPSCLSPCLDILRATKCWSRSRRRGKAW